MIKSFNQLVIDAIVQANEIRSGFNMIATSDAKQALEISRTVVPTIVDETYGERYDYAIHGFINMFIAHESAYATIKEGASGRELANFKGLIHADIEKIIVALDMYEGEMEFLAQWNRDFHPPVGDDT